MKSALKQGIFAHLKIISSPKEKKNVSFNFFFFTKLPN